MSILRQKKIILTAIIPLFLIIALSVQSYAATINVTTTSMRGLEGIAYSVNLDEGFAISNPAFMVSLTDETANATLASPATWTNGDDATGALTAGQWQFQMTLTSDASVPVDSYKAVVQIDRGTGYTAHTLYFDVGTLTTAGHTMEFFYSMGTNIENVSAIVITIAPV
ncbi:MAG TPA: hypothetical protein VLH35_06095 [Candidatus Acidoferrales bacterium]|nr:hypothetical protein [Candidatus Acidoferrales bacterium]